MAQFPVVAATIVVTVVLGLAAHYFLGSLWAEDPLGLFVIKEENAPETVGPFAGKREVVQEAAIDELLSALDESKSKGKGKGKRRSRGYGGLRVSGSKEDVAGKHKIEDVVEELVLDGLVERRQKRQRRARQHAQETVEKVVEEAALALGHGHGHSKHTHREREREQGQAEEGKAGGVQGQTQKEGESQLAEGQEVGAEKKQGSR